jgi:hypothetical protein
MRAPKVDELVLGIGFLWLLISVIIYFGYHSGTAVLVAIGISQMFFLSSIVIDEVKKVGKPRCPRAHLENHNAPSCVLCLGWDLPKDV